MKLSITTAKTLKPKPDETQLGFGTKFTDHMFNMDYSVRKGLAQPAHRALCADPMDPATMVLHYGQGVFEGLKAYRTADGRIQLFRPHDNLRRLNRSNDILCIPRFDESLRPRGVEGAAQGRKGLGAAGSRRPRCTSGRPFMPPTPSSGCGPPTPTASSSSSAPSGLLPRGSIP